MIAPFYKYGLFGDEVSLILAAVIGVGFGFFLERAGFGSSRKLAAQFYFTDMAVFKVMFSAIVTAMLGLFYLSWAGLVDISMVYVSPTYLLPQLIGGLVLGLGFIVGGYCPGTSVVGMSTGRLDAFAFGGGDGRRRRDHRAHRARPGRRRQRDDLLLLGRLQALPQRPHATCRDPVDGAHRQSGQERRRTAEPQR